MELFDRNPDIDYVNPSVELNIGLWSLWAGATGFLVARLWTKSSRRHGLWWDDYLLVLSWIVLTCNDALICAEYATGYVNPHWDDRMHIMINTSSCGTLIGLSLTKTAFAVTLLKLTRGFKHWKICHAILCFCIVTMCTYNFIKCLFEWCKVCGDPGYQQWYRLDFCIDAGFRSHFKEDGNIYNIVMDFVFAAFPWVITWNLDMTKKEKIGLCITMSLGIVVAIESAIRTEWKYSSQKKNEWYFWNNAMSNIWYSSEVAGTIIVQCVPVFRTLLKEFHTSMRSKKLMSSNDEIALESGKRPNRYSIRLGSVSDEHPGDRAAGNNVGRSGGYWKQPWYNKAKDSANLKVSETVDERLVGTGVETVCYHAK